jgi:adenylosuccinate synthase
LGEEYGVTTGRRRKVNWLNLDMLINAIRVTGTTHLVVSKCDVIKKLGQFKLSYGGRLISFSSLEEMINFIDINVRNSSSLIEVIKFSYSPKVI